MKSPSENKVRDEILSRIYASIDVVAKTSSGMAFDDNINLLYIELFNDKKINFGKKLFNLRFFPSNRNNQYLGTELRNTLFSLKKIKKVTYDDLTKRLGSIVAKIAKSPLSKYELIFPINIKTKIPIKTVKIRDLEISIIDYKKSKKYVDTKQAKSKLKELDSGFKLSEYTFVKVSVVCRNAHFAVKEASRGVFLVVGLISLLLHYGRATISLFGFPHSINPISLSLIFIYCDKNFQDVLFYEEYSTKKKITVIDDEQIENFNKLSTKLQKATKEIQSFVWDAIRNFYHGLNEDDVNFSFLHFWTALEIVTLKDKSISHKEVIRRLKTLFKSGDIGDYKIDRLYSLRNNLIHDGNYSSITQFDRNYLKYLVEHAIVMFLNEFYKFSKEEISVLFRYLGVKKESINNTKRLLNFILRIKDK